MSSKTAMTTTAPTACRKEKKTKRKRRRRKKKIEDTKGGGGGNSSSGNSANKNILNQNKQLLIKFVESNKKLVELKKKVFESKNNKKLVVWNFSTEQFLLFKIILTEHTDFIERTVNIKSICFPLEMKCITSKKNADSIINQLQHLTEG